MHSSGDQGQSNNYAIGLRGCLVDRLTELETRYLRLCCSTYFMIRLAATAAGRVQELRSGCLERSRHRLSCRSDGLYSDPTNFIPAS